MALGVTLTVKSLFRPKLGKRRRTSASSVEMEKKPREDMMSAPEPEKLREPVVDEQLHSSFLQKLPVEIRTMIYSYLWQNKHDHHYHVPNGRHIHFKNGRWVNARCVMNAADEDPDFIQKQMDAAVTTDRGHMHMWQNRLASTWGHRHWRCEERINHSRKGFIFRSDFASLIIVCKRMYPEVMESIFRTHTFFFNDTFSAHRFLVTHPPQLVQHMRNLDLTLCTRSGDYSVVAHDKSAEAECRLNDIWASLGRMHSLKTLRVSLDVYDRGPWRIIPEQGAIEGLRNLRVLQDFKVELPPKMPLQNIVYPDHVIDEDEVPFTVVRRPPLRYWEFSPWHVERFQWETQIDGDITSCWITLLTDTTPIKNPYLDK
jgi:hypothetical protein